MSAVMMASGFTAWGEESEMKTESAETVIETEAEGSSDSAVADLLSRMTTREKVGQLFVPCFRTWVSDSAQDGDSEQVAAVKTSEAEEVPMTALRPEVKQLISENRFGGVILYAENCSDGNEMTLELINSMQAANQDTDSDCVIPLIIATDEEGGIVARLSEGTPGIGNMALTATGNIENIREEGSILGRELRNVGINTSFAPVIDVNNNASNPVIGCRSFSDDPAVVSENGIAFMNAMSGENIITSLKHFPGHGNTDTDSHTGLPMVDKSYEELQQCELIPFQAAIDAGAEAIMTAHIQYPQIETEKWISTSSGEEIYLPATLSHTILTDILRGDMGFDGVVVSDALVMDAIKDNFVIEDACTKAINAGVDLILSPILINSAETAARMVSILDTITERVESGDISQERLDEAVTRILTLKENHGLLTPLDTNLTQERKDAATDQDSLAADIQTVWGHATEAVTLVKNTENVLPVKAEEGDSVLYVCSSSMRPYAADMAMTRLKGEGLVPESIQYQSLVANADSQEACVEAAKTSDYICLVTSFFDTSSFNPDTDAGLVGRIFDSVIEEAHNNGNKVILLSSILPYDAARYQSADAIVLCYGSSARTAPATGLTAYIPNLIAGMCSVFGEFEPAGVLPVTIPKLDENWNFTDEALYERGFSLNSSAE